MTPSTTAQSVDLVILGGAMAGATLALAAEQLRSSDGRRLSIALIEAHEGVSLAPSSFDDRSIALAAGSVAHLQQWGLWPAMAPLAQPIEQIVVSDKGHFGGLTLTAADHQVTAFGQVIELATTGAYLWQQLRQSTVQLHCPARLSQLQLTNNGAHLYLDNGQQLQAKLVVGSDGQASSLRHLLGIATEQYDYQQTALIANLRFEQHHNTAFERFTAEGPLALLPMSQQRYSLVWVQSPQQAQRRLQLDERQFAQECQRAFGHRLGRITQVGQRQDYPLSLTYAQRLHWPRCLLIGNAAQTLHPIAGQGFNLGLRDVAALINQLQKALDNNQDCGQWSYLQDYVDERQPDRNRMIGFTHGLVQLFSQSAPLLALGRNSGLLAMALKPQWQRALVRQALG